jgi:hypothetical protein
MDDGARDLPHLVKFFSPLVDGTAPTQLVGAQLTSVMFRFGRGGDMATAARDWVREFRSHDLPDPPPPVGAAPDSTKGKGGTWFDKVFDYTCDEPPTYCPNKTWGDIAPRARTLHSVDRDFRTLVTTRLDRSDAHGVTGDIDILTPTIYSLDQKPGVEGVPREDYDKFLAARPQRELWTYQSCVTHGCGGSDSYTTGWPSYVIDTLSIRARAEEWLSFELDLSGELYWDTAFANGLGDAWKTQWADEFTGNGDGTLFYPGTVDRISGKTDIPIATLRLKMIREGMEDYEYLKALSDAGDPKFAKAAANALFPNAWTQPSTAKLLAARRAIAERIVALVHGARVEDLADALPDSPQVTDLGTDPNAAPPPIVKPYTSGEKRGHGIRPAAAGGDDDAAAAARASAAAKAAKEAADKAAADAKEAADAKAAPGAPGQTDAAQADAAAEAAANAAADAQEAAADAAAKAAAAAAQTPPSSPPPPASPPPPSPPPASTPAPTTPSTTPPASAPAPTAPASTPSTPPPAPTAPTPTAPASAPAPTAPATDPAPTAPADPGTTTTSAPADAPPASPTTTG